MVDHSKDSPERQAYRLAHTARSRALTKYEDGWRYFSEEVQEALVLSEVALIIGQQDLEKYAPAVAVVDAALVAFEQVTPGSTTRRVSS
jgi:hypothetical protein